MNMDNIEIIVGTYDSLILGFKLVNKLDGSYGLETSFTDDPHEGALRCVYVSPGGTLVSTTSHTSVRLHNLVKRKSLGELYQHDDQVNYVTFYKQSHMFTASDDGTVCMWKTKNWEMMRVLKGHKSHVLAVAVHPSGKLGLSVGSDRSLLTWDLVTGKLAFQRKIKEAATNILFTSDGSHYILVYTRRVEICSLEDTSTVVEIPTSWRINSVCLIKDNVLAVGGDDRFIRLFDVLSGKELLTLDMAGPQEDGFTSRVRCICATVCGTRDLLVAATSSGNIKVFEVNLTERTTNEVLTHAARVRVTCMAVHNSNSTLDKGEPSKPGVKKQVKSRKKHSTQTVANPPHDDDDNEDDDAGDEEEEDGDESESSNRCDVKVATRHDGRISKDAAGVKSVPNKKRKQQLKSSPHGDQKTGAQTLETQTSIGKIQKKKIKTVSSSGVRALSKEPTHKLKKRKLHK